MKKIFQFIFSIILIFLLVVGIAFAANTFPTALNSWSAGDVIESDWANALETKIGIDNSAVVTSIDYLIKNTSSKLGKIASLSVTDGNFVVADGTNWTAESGATARTSIGLGSVENTALSTWAGTTNITILGTIATGTWQGTAIDISDYTNLVAGTGITLTGDTLSVDLGTSIDISTETNLAVSGTLLNLTGDTLNVKEGTLTDAKGCKFTTASGLVCDQDYISATLTEEEVEDFVGGMLGGTETNITVTYEDATNDIDFVVTDAWWNALTDMVLTDTYIYVGNASNDPVGVTMSGEASITNLGAVSVLAMEGVDFGTMTDTKVCTYDSAGTEIDCATTMTLDEVGTLTNTKWCTTDGSVVNCQSNAPVLTEVDPSVDSEAEIEAITGAYFGASKAVTGGYIWVADGTDFESVVMSGDLTIASGGTTTIGANKILEGMLKEVSTTPTDEDILTYEATDGDFEWHSKADLGIGVATSITDNLIVKADFANEDWGDVSITSNVAYVEDLTISGETQGDVLYFNGSNWIRLAADAGKYLKSGAAAVFWDTPAGAGDVESVGDCASGDCLDGSSDGGTYIRLYDGDSHYLELNPGNISANRIINFRDAAGTVILSGDTFTGDVTATLDTDGSTVLSIGGAVIVEADLDADEAPADNDILTFDTTGANFSWQTPTELSLAAVNQTMYIGTTGVAINRGSAALTLAGITLTTPDIGTPSAGNLANCTFPTLNQNTTGSAATLTTPRAIGGVSFDGSAAITPTTIVVADTEDATTFVGLWTDATGSLLPKTDEQLTYVANTGVLTAAGFAGPLTGDVTGNVSGTAATVTGATQASITTLANVTTVGTIGTGIWQATDIGVAYGGTGVSTLTDHGVLVGSGAGAITALTVGTNGQLLVGSTGADPVFVTLNADRSLTATTGAGTLEIDADAETYVFKAKIAFEDPTATDDFFFEEIATAVTFTSIYCKTLVGTVELDVQIAGADINGTDISCTTSGVLDDSLGGDTAGAVGEELKLAITSVASSPTYLMVQVNGTYND